MGQRGICEIIIRQDQRIEFPQLLEMGKPVVSHFRAIEIEAFQIIECFNVFKSLIADARIPEIQLTEVRQFL